ncbi:MAG: extracellular solute-binding protein [Oscillospiraceae bacterium]|nr:extracellular solute-binding protein [Oscillospiraceae bacterium]
MKKAIERLYLAIIFLFLYAPIATLIVLSFNSSKSRANWGGFTTQWYSEMLSSEVIMDALGNSLSIALFSAVISTVIGLLACIGINAMRKGPKTICLTLNNIPMLNAEIVTGLSLMICFGVFGVSLGYGTILVSHVAFCIPYVILSIMPRLKQTSTATYEAAQDLGATPLQAFFQVVLPDLMPGVLSGFLMAFTMSLDDFVISYFTRGRGINTISTLVYSQVRRGIVPTMYALSTVIFLAVLVFLLAQNFLPQKLDKLTRKLHEKRSLKGGDEGGGKWVMVAAGVLAVTALILLIVPGGEEKEEEVVYVYNCGEYIDEAVIDIFEEETGIRVVYDTFETLEAMYPIIEQGQAVYDVVCPSDYMIQKMIANDLLTPIDFSNVPNLEYIGQDYLQACRSFDPNNEYAVPYTWGTVGILYNTKLMDEVPNSWSILWDERYDNEILMQKSVRDAFAVALAYQGSSINATDPEEILAARDLLMAQKPLVQAYVVDQVRDKMIGGEAAMGVIYSGEYLYCHDENPDLAYVVPDEGSCVWFDCWVIPKNAENKENAEAWINFLCRPDIAMMNFEYITYASPNTAVIAELDEEIVNDPGVFADEATMGRCEVFTWLGDEVEEIYNESWLEILAYSDEAAGVEAVDPDSEE